jgi:hypothetical protein
MDSYHDIFSQWLVTISFTYNGRLPEHLLTMNGYHYIYLQCKVTIAYTYTMGGYHTIYLQWSVTFISSCNER